MDDPWSQRTKGIQRFSLEPLAVLTLELTGGHIKAHRVTEHVLVSFLFWNVPTFLSYYDGQFDDSRLLIHLAATAADHGAALANYMPVTELLKDEEGYLNGVIARDDESGIEYTIHAQVVVNATGIFTDHIRQMADPESTAMVEPSQGIHLVFERSFLHIPHKLFQAAEDA